MIFSSLTFLWVFLPFTVLIYFILPKIALKNFFLFIMSLFFYSWGEPKYIVIMVISIVINYVMGLTIEKTKRKKQAVAIAVIANLSILGYYKYINFCIDNLNQILGLGIRFEEIALPIGISFYTFQSISYLVDIYRGNVKAQRNFVKMGLYISLFPQLVAGPIVKYHNIAKQIDFRRVSLDGFSYGVKRFVFGLGKKVLIANVMGSLADNIMIGETGGSSIAAWVGVLAYALQIYYDFSGYSDMAIGLSRMFGFRLLENFDYPYISKSIKEFWRRWHISLSTWFRDYLYIPLGGNRVAPYRVYVNLIIVFFATGLWHGANWNFVIWGMWHGMFLIFEKLFNLEKALKFNVVRHVYTLAVVLVGWVFFRIEALPEALKYIKLMFSFNMGDLAFLNSYLNRENILMMVAGIIGGGQARIPKFKINSYKGIAYNAGVSIFLIAVLNFAILYMAGSTYNPFIYFRF